MRNLCTQNISIPTNPEPPPQKQICMFNIQHMIPIPNDKLTTHAAACNKFDNKPNTYAMKLNRTFLGGIFSDSFGGSRLTPPFQILSKGRKKPHPHNDGALQFGITTSTHPIPPHQKRNNLSPNKMPPPQDTYP